MSGNLRELSAVLAKFKSCLLVTSGPHGLRGRPMALQQRETDGSLWLATSLDSDKARDLQVDPRCAVLCHDGQSSVQYVSLAGHGDLVRDRARIRELWDPLWRAWFPEGPEQGDLILIHFHASHAEYVNPEGGKVEVILSAVKRILTHARVPKPEKSELELPGPWIEPPHLA